MRNGGMCHIRAQRSLCVHWAKFVGVSWSRKVPNRVRTFVNCFYNTFITFEVY